MGTRRRLESAVGNDPLWYKDALIYQTHVRAFFDSNDDGIGDFRGLTEKLEYLQDLGVTAIWILPFYPSPLKDDGYDIADYSAVNQSFGSLRDVRAFVRAAHDRGLRVITEMVFNHTSDQHAWFQRARTARPGSSYRDYYVWSDTPDKYSDARIIFKDFEHSNWAWDHVANAYYWHRFYSHQPDLNFENPRVHEGLFRAIDLWLEMGIDGLRLDAIPYLYEEEGTTSENLPRTHQFLKKVRAHVDTHFPNRMLLAEANQWPEDAVEYFGAGDECHMAFHFPVMPRLYMAVRMEDRHPIIDILDQTPAIPEAAQWAMFLRNHDELTLEMVTDEERDYMYRSYAQDPAARINLGIRRRLAPLMYNNRRRIELMKGLLFSLPGTPIIYYGDEIGMGDNIFLGDRNGVRTPMQWSGDRNAGFSKANSQRLYFPVITDPEYHYSTVNVETQQANPQSLLWWMKRLIALRKRYRAFGRGTIEFLHPENRKVLAFVRRFEEETILVVANLSRFVQAVELDLSAWRGFSPIEMFGNNTFPSIGELPYFVTLGPHSFYWFSLEPQRVTGERIVTGEEPARLPVLTVAGDWTSLFDGARGQLERVLTGYLVERRWFRGKARQLRGVRTVDLIPFTYGDDLARIVVLQVDYAEGDPELYVLPLACAEGERAQQLLEEQGHAVVASIRAGESEGVLYDAIWEGRFADALLQAIGRRKRLKGEHGTILASMTRAGRELAAALDGGWPEASNVRGEQSNSSVAFGDRFMLKLFRKLEDGLNPDLEIGRFLTEESSFQQFAPVAGSLEYQPGGNGARMTLGILQRYVVNEGDAWTYTLDTLGDFFERALASRPDVDAGTLTVGTLFDMAAVDPPEQAQFLIRSFLEDARLLGQRTAEMHLALAAGEGPQFAPEPTTMMYQRSVYQTMRNQLIAVMHTLSRQLPNLPDAFQAEARRVLDAQPVIQTQFHRVVDARIRSARVRYHGDYHLGQVLHTGHDFVIIDFEGEPARTLADRRQKRSPLRDVAGMLRSFHYAAYSALFDQRERGLIGPDDPAPERWARYWYGWVAATFLRAYFEAAGAAVFLPAERATRELLLDVFLLDKAVYEVGYELNNRPNWVQVPLRGITDLLSAQPAERTP